MENEMVEKKVKSLICEHLSVEDEKVTPTASIRDDLGADSLDIVELVMHLEEEFNVVIPEEEATKLKTVADVVHFIARSKVQQ